MNLTGMVLPVVLPLLAVTAVLAFMRLARGPSVPDRVLALDLMATLGIGMAAVYAIAMQQPAFLDVAMILALISFVGTVAFAYYLRSRE